MKINHQQANKFFYKYYNDGIEDQEILDHVSDTLYKYVISEIQKYKVRDNNKLNYDQFTFALYNKINDCYADDITTLKNNIT